MNGKFLITLLGSILAVLAITKSETNIIEHWWGGIPAMNVKNDWAVANSRGQMTSLSNHYFNPSDMRGSGQFVSTPQFQALLSPRMNPNQQYGTFIKYNTPDHANLAVPNDPLTFGDWASKENSKENNKENYSGDGQGTGLRCRDNQNVNANINNDYALPTGYTNGNYKTVYDTLSNNGEEAPVVSSPCSGDSYSNMLPIGTMSAMDSMGNEEQVVVVNDLHVVPLKSRLAEGADFIRGDIPIVPNENIGWFNSPANVQNLRAGAMQVLNGDGESNAKLMELLITASGGAKTAFGGSDLRENNTNLSTNVRSFLSQGQNTVQAMAYP